MLMGVHCTSDCIQGCAQEMPTKYSQRGLDFHGKKWVTHQHDSLCTQGLHTEV